MTTKLKRDSESWRQFIARIGKVAGVREQCLEAFDFAVDGGSNHEDAALAVIDDWLDDYEGDSE